MYSNSKKALTNSRYAKKAQKHRRIFLWLLLILLISIVIAAVTIVRGPYLHIDDVTVNIINQDKSINQDEIDKIKSQISEIVADTYLYIVPKGTIITFPRSSAEQQIAASDTSLSSVRIKSDGLHGLIVDITVREPKAISCVTGSDLESDEVMTDVKTESLEPADTVHSTSKCKFLDKNGYAYAEAPAYSPGVYVVFFATSTADFGQHIVDLDKYKTFLDFADNLKQFTGNVDRIKFEDNQEYVVEVLFDKSSQPVEILFNDHGTANNALSVAIGRTLKFIDNKYTAYKSKQANAPALSDLQYIDGRYGATVYFKYRNSGQTANVSE